MSVAAAAVALSASRIFPQSSQGLDAHIDIVPAEPIGPIAPQIYGQFIEQLGGVIYDGVWVGESRSIPNDRGVRKAFIDAMREIKAPVLRWPGGCFADSYDWRDGIGADRPQRSAYWGQEDTNRFGTHEFMYTCRAIGCEPYLGGNLRSLPAKDLYQWVEYCNAPAGIGNDLAQRREKNGSREPFNVRYWGIGNESWGCGGEMTPEEYAASYRRTVAFLPQYGGRNLDLVAVGPNGHDLDWTRRLLKALNGRFPWGLSTHYYVSGGSNLSVDGDALVFSEDEFYLVLARANMMDKILCDQWAALQELDDNHKVKFVVDEWGASNGSSTQIGPQYKLSQIPTMRDALVTAITLDVFHHHADKVAMACVAQTINCLHSLMLAREDEFIITPIFHVFKMYSAHMGAQSIRTEFSAPSITNRLAQDTAQNKWGVVGYMAPNSTLPGLSGSASIRGKHLTLTVVNSNIHKPLTTGIFIRDRVVKEITGSALDTLDIHAHNTFENPTVVQIGQIANARLRREGEAFVYTFPPASVTAFTLTLS
jgi:alpha-N-arabinofuranosidase